jgi:hypothetical protein
MLSKPRRYAAGDHALQLPETVELKGPAAYFPATLESLTVVCPTGAILEVLNGVQDARLRGGIANLHKVILLCRCSHGVAL